MAAKCRTLADATDDPRAIDALRKLAEEFDSAAEAAAADAALDHGSPDDPLHPKPTAPPTAE